MGWISSLSRWNDDIVQDQVKTSVTLMNLYSDHGWRKYWLIYLISWLESYNGYDNKKDLMIEEKWGLFWFLWHECALVCAKVPAGKFNFSFLHKTGIQNSWLSFCWFDWFSEDLYVRNYSTIFWRLLLTATNDGQIELVITWKHRWIKVNSIIKSLPVCLTWNFYSSKFDIRSTTVWRRVKPYINKLQISCWFQLTGDKF